MTEMNVEKRQCCGAICPAGSKAVQFYFWLVLLFLSGGSEALIAGPKPDLWSLLLFGTNEATVVRPSFSDKAKDLEGKFQKAISSRPDWWMNYVQKNSEIRPLPYHTNFGITQAEYSTLLALYKTRGLTKVRTMEFVCKRLDEGRIVISSPQLPEAVAPVTFNTVTMAAETPLAVLPKGELIDVKEKNGGGIFGPHTGYRWEFERGNIESGEFKSVNLNLIKRESDQVLFLYYTGKRMEDYEFRDNFELILELPRVDTNRIGSPAEVPRKR